MTSNADQSLPKPLFPSIGRMYSAVLSMDMVPSALNMNQADTVVRTLARTNWKNDNEDIYKMWNGQGESWVQLVKDVRAYSKEVSKHRRSSKK